MSIEPPRVPTRSPVGAKGMRLLVLALCGVVIVTTIAVMRAGRTLGHIERQAAINAELPRIDRVLVDLLNAETGQRGYLLTGRSAYLEPYLDAVQDLDGQVTALIERNQGDGAAQAQYLRVQTLVHLKLADMRETIRLQDRGRLASALELMKSDKGQRLADELRAVIKQLVDRLSEERDTLGRQIAEEASVTRTLLIVSTTLLVFFVSMAMWKISSTMRDNARLVQRLEDEATHDVLTGLANRRYLVGWLEQSVALAARGGASVAVLFIDLDGFKQVNDVCGHEAGDKLLQSVSAAFKGTLRQSDLLCRLGGDEFAVIAVDASGRDALQLVGQRLIEAVVALPRLEHLPDHVVGASVGVAVHPADGDTADKLLDAADHAMYAAKQAGKRRVRFASTPEAIQPSRETPAPQSALVHQ